jgi:1-deoxy-D-xylulose-5-phosphate synthase
MVNVGLEAARILAGSNIDVGVVDARFVKPLDRQLIMSIADRGTPIVTLEESAVSGGFGDAVIGLVCGSGSAARVRAIGLPDRFMPHGKREELLEEAGLTPSAVANAVTDLLASRAPESRGGSR